MRRILPLLLCALVGSPLYAHAEEEDTQTPVKAAKKKKKKVVKKHAAPEPKGESRAEDLNSAARKPDAPVAAPAAAAPVAATEETEEVDDEAPTSFRRHRYGYFLGAGFLVAGLAFAYSAQGEAKRAETILSAREASSALDNARASAATSNVMYGMGAATLVVALIFELLPEPVAEKASLTFHF